MKNVRVIYLSSGDTCAVLTESADKGDRITFDNCDCKENVTALERVPKWHKIAVKSVKAGGKVYKSGAVIGIATLNITAGEYVHTHNERSPEAGVRA